jgi:hypothetical protein
LVLSEPLSDVEVEALAVAFAAYVGTLFEGAMTAGNLAADIARAEVTALERMYALTDPRYVH